MLIAGAGERVRAIDFPVGRDSARSRNLVTRVRGEESARRKEEEERVTLMRCEKCTLPGR